MTDGVNPAGEMLKDFIRSFQASLDPRLWLDLIKEEKIEVEEAVTKEDKLKEAMDLLYVTTGFNLVAAGSEQLQLWNEDEYEEVIEFVMSAGDTYEKAVEELGDDVDLFEAFRRVHMSNMSKLGDDGKPLRREDGKILKGPHYRKPELADLVS